MRVSVLCLVASLGCAGSRASHDAPPAAEPKPKLESEVAPPPSRLRITPRPDFAVVATPSGVVVLDEAGQQVDVLLPQPVDWCRVDARAEVLWFQTNGALSFLDLRTAAPPVEIIDASPDVIVIRYPDERIGLIEDHMFEDGLAVVLDSQPRLETMVGCDGDMAWYCFEDVDDFELARSERIEARNRELADRAIPTDVLAELAARAVGRRLTPTVPPRSVEPTTVTAVPRDACLEIEEDCGAARRLDGTPYWLVVVANDRGDFFHETERLYDPSARVFFDPRQPTRRSPTPLPDDGPGFVPWLVSPSGTHAVAGDELVAFSSGVIARDLTGACGFWGGGWEILTYE